MKKGKQLVEELRELVEAVPPQFQKKNGNGKENGKENGNDSPKPGDGKAGSDQVIKALRDTDYKDKDAFFKMVQLLKGLAVNSEKDDTAKKFMSAVSDALTSAAKKVLGEDVLEDEDDGDSDILFEFLNQIMEAGFVPKGGYARALKRINDAAKRGGFDGMIKATTTRIKAMKDPGKIQGLIEALDYMIKSLESLRRKASMSY